MLLYHCYDIYSFSLIKSLCICSKIKAFTLNVTIVFVVDM